MGEMVEPGGEAEEVAQKKRSPGRENELETGGDPPCLAETTAAVPEMDSGKKTKTNRSKSPKTKSPTRPLPHVISYSLSPNHKELVRAGSSLGSVSLPPVHITLPPNHNELVWAGSSLGTIHKMPVHLNSELHRDLVMAKVNGQNLCTLVPKIGGSSVRFGSQTVSDTGTDMMSICRICQMPGDEKDPLFSPCRCSGSLRYVHNSCLKKWITICTRKRKGRPPRCELCHYQYQRHKHFKFSQWRWPRVSPRDKCLHIVFFLNLLIMVGCAIATIMCFLSDRGQISKFPKNKVELTSEEIITLACGVMFFVAFFIAMTVEIKARHTLYKLMRRFVMHNTEWTVDEYDPGRDTQYKVMQVHYV